MLVTTVFYGKEIILKVGNKVIKIKPFLRQDHNKSVCIGIDAPEDVFISTPGRRKKNLLTQKAAL